MFVVSELSADSQGVEELHNIFLSRGFHCVDTVPGVDTAVNFTYLCAPTCSCQFDCCGDVTGGGIITQCKVILERGRYPTDCTLHKTTNI